MSRLLFVTLTAAVLFVAAGSGQSPAKKSALDKATLETYVRHLFVMDSRINVQISDPKPSPDLPGFVEVVVHAAAGAQSQDFKFLVSKDGSKIIQGTVFDAAVNPHNLIAGHPACAKESCRVKRRDEDWSLKGAGPASRCGSGNGVRRIRYTYRDS